MFFFFFFEINDKGNFLSSHTSTKERVCGWISRWSVLKLTRKKNWKKKKEKANEKKNIYI